MLWKCSQRALGACLALLLHAACASLFFTCWQGILIRKQLCREQLIWGSSSYLVRSPGIFHCALLKLDSVERNSEDSVFCKKMCILLKCSKTVNTARRGVNYTCRQRNKQPRRTKPLAYWICRWCLFKNPSQTQCGNKDVL